MADGDTLAGREAGTNPQEPSERRFGEILLSIENVSLSFGGVQALSDVSFDIRKGEIRAIIGPNGAGKSSMLNVINGFYHPQQGTITFKGNVRQTMRPHEAAADPPRLHHGVRPVDPRRRSVRQLRQGGGLHGSRTP